MNLLLHSVVLYILIEKRSIYLLELYNNSLIGFCRDMFSKLLIIIIDIFFIFKSVLNLKPYAYF